MYYSQLFPNSHYCPTKQKGSNCSFGKALIITIFMTFKPTFVIWPKEVIQVYTLMCTKKTSNSICI